MQYPAPATSSISPRRQIAHNCSLHEAVSAVMSICCTAFAELAADDRRLAARQPADKVRKVQALIGGSIGQRFFEALNG